MEATVPNSCSSPEVWLTLAPAAPYAWRTTLEAPVCRNIKRLYNFTPPATPIEIEASALQYVRKVSGMTNPSAANREAFDRAVEEITAITRRLLLEDLETTAVARTRAEEAERAKERGRQRVERIRAELATD